MRAPATRAPRKPYLRATFGGQTVTSEHVPDAQNRERFAEMGRRSGESRRAKKQRRDPRAAIQEEIDRLLVEAPREVVTSLLKTAAGAQILLQLGAGLSAQQEAKPTLIVLKSAFPDDSYRRTHGHWLRLLREQNLAQLEAELKVHAEEAAA